eukprot:m.299879 g.299879  ORF g.299879 m.299879 type:complete len:413 (-) comp14279_c0_seq1:188-1426(-)
MLRGIVVELATVVAADDSTGAVACAMGFLPTLTTLAATGLTAWTGAGCLSAVALTPEADTPVVLSLAAGTAVAGGAGAGGGFMEAEVPEAADCLGRSGDLMLFACVLTVKRLPLVDERITRAEMVPFDSAGAVAGRAGATRDWWSEAGCEDAADVGRDGLGSLLLAAEVAVEAIEDAASESVAERDPGGGGGKADDGVGVTSAAAAAAEVSGGASSVVLRSSRAPAGLSSASENSASLAGKTSRSLPVFSESQADESETQREMGCEGTEVTLKRPLLTDERRSDEAADDATAVAAPVEGAGGGAGGAIAAFAAVGCRGAAWGSFAGAACAACAACAAGRAFAGLSAGLLVLGSGLVAVLGGAEPGVGGSTRTVGASAGRSVAARGSGAAIHSCGGPLGVLSASDNSAVLGLP